jgi:DNA-binding response OmpR family regulator
VALAAAGAERPQQPNRVVHIVCRRVYYTYAREEALELTDDPGTYTILVVDDELDLRSQLAEHLEEEGYRVLTASTGIDALRFIRTKQPDLVLLDVNMPGWLDGFRVLEAVRGDDGMRDTQIIMLTGVTDVNRVRAAIEQGVRDYVVKPYGLRDISARVEKLFKDRPANPH